MRAGALDGVGGSLGPTLVRVPPRGRARRGTDLSSRARGSAANAAAHATRRSSIRKDRDTSLRARAGDWRAGTRSCPRRSGGTRVGPTGSLDGATWRDRPVGEGGRSRWPCESGRPGRGSMPHGGHRGRGLAESAGVPRCPRRPGRDGHNRWLARVSQGDGGPIRPRRHVILNSGSQAHDLLPGAHRAASLAKRWLLGTHQGGVKPGHLPAYLDEFTFRFNRRRSRSRGLVFYRLLSGAVAARPRSYRWSSGIRRIKRGRPSLRWRTGERGPSLWRRPAWVGPGGRHQRMPHARPVRSALFVPLNRSRVPEQARR